jgi:hypothetical protein
VKGKRPNIITLIGDVNVFCAFLLILSLFSFFKRFGIKFYSLPMYVDIPITFKHILIVLYAIILLTISYGYLRLKTWGYWALICYYIVSIVGWIISYQYYKQHFFPQAIIMLIIALIFTLPTIRYYKKS